MGKDFDYKENDFFKMNTLFYNLEFLEKKKIKIIN